MYTGLVLDFLKSLGRELLFSNMLYMRDSVSVMMASAHMFVAGPSLEFGFKC